MPITVGIPFYNAEAYLCEAIRSVFAQSYTEWELILVDDGSNDRSLEMALSIQDPRVRVIADGENRRLSYRLNQIVAEAKYDFVARMDADDMMSPSRLEKEINILQRLEYCDLVSTGMCAITNGGKPIGIRGAKYNGEINAKGLVYGRGSLNHATILGRRAWFLRNEYDPSIDRAEDYELWLRAYSKNDFRVHVVNEPLYYYREESNVIPERLLTAYASQRRILAKYRGLMSSRVDLPVAMASSYCKSSIVCMLAVLNKTHVLLRRRNEPIVDADVLDRCLKEIGTILSTKIPGLD